jgi:hypothetical protein
MMAFERTHLLRHDLDWLPGWLKALRWTVAGTVWAGLFGGVAALVAFSHVHVIFFGKGLAALALGGIYAGDKAARGLLRRRLVKLAHGDVDIKRLKHEADGELVHVKGRVKARQRLTGMLGGEGVYRRLLINIGEQKVVHEAAVDFHLVDESGEMILVQTAGARLIAQEPDKKPLTGDVVGLVKSLSLPPKAQAAAGEWEFRFKTGKSTRAVSGGEVLISDGQEVEIVGYKSRTVDPTIVERLERETPLRATLRGGKELPLLISFV